MQKVPNTPKGASIPELKIGTKHTKGAKRNRKKIKNRATQEYNEYVFEDNADKNDKEDSDVHKNINEQENKNGEKKRNLHYETLICSMLLPIPIC